MRVVNAIFAALGVIVAAYLFGAFVAADFNISHWDNMGRFLLACLAAMLGTGAFGYTLEASK